MPNTFTKITPKQYHDNRPAASLRLDAQDHGVVFRHGDSPNNCDLRGAREAVVAEEDGVYHLFYDGAGENGWLACVATSTDLIHWTKHGAVLDFGATGSGDEGHAGSPWMIFHDDWWHMFYLATPNTSPAPDYVPNFPYLTYKARARKLLGPWEKQYDVKPFVTKEATYYGTTASPGYVIEQEGEFLQFFSGSFDLPEAAIDGPTGRAKVHRTLGIARTRDLNGTWTVDPTPVVPGPEQIENSSVYYQASNQTWYLFTNHVGGGPDPDQNGRVHDYTDAIWVYWSKDPNHWDPANKAIVMDGENSTWAKCNIGMPAVVPVGDRLAILYDGVAGEHINHMGRDIALAWLDLPLPDALT